MVEISVSDEGPGIPEASLERIFERASTPRGQRARSSARIRASACRSRARSSTPMAARCARRTGRASATGPA
ncbi:MAG: ATP-binding protein, partial [Alphaproteobacteria bacterium]